MTTQITKEKSVGAYDYDKQEWVFGHVGQTLRVHQLTTELQILVSPRGSDYARFIGADREEAIANLERQLKELEVA